MGGDLERSEGLEWIDRRDDFHDFLQGCENYILTGPPPPLRWCAPAKSIIEKEAEDEDAGVRNRPAKREMVSGGDSDGITPRLLD